MTRRNWVNCSTAGWCHGLRLGKSTSICAWTRAMTMPTSAARSPDAGISRTSHTGAKNRRLASLPAGEPIAGWWSERIAGTTCFGGSRFATRSMPRITLALSSWPAPSFVSGGPAHLFRDALLTTFSRGFRAFFYAEPRKTAEITLVQGLVKTTGSEFSDPRVIGKRRGEIRSAFRVLRQYPQGLTTGGQSPVSLAG